MRETLLAVTLLAILIGACADPGEEAATDPTSEAWLLQAGTLDGGDIPIVEGFPITLIFDQPEGTAGGKSACNQWFGGYTLSGNELTFSDLGGTMMACADESVMDSETAFLASLGLVEIFTIENEELNLTGEGVDLVFVVDESAATS
ncbi:MAG TPA: META domain-containing protein [Acidimicrobiia bacterium]|nr:META domain-containing protein [Acidimicrobiia bacterium]